MHENMRGEITSTSTLEFEEEFLSDVVENFQMFLRGCGYYFDGNLDFVKEDTMFEDKDYDFEPLEDAIKRMREDARARKLAEQSDCV
jgi:hypothetical protein